MRVNPVDDDENFAARTAVYKNGPLEDRQSTDVYCMILFLFNVGLVFAIAISAYVMGNPSKMFTTTDSDGNICGLGTATGYDYVYLTNPLPSTTSFTSDSIIINRVCVRSCIKNTNITKVLDCFPNSIVKNCTPTFVITSNDDQIPQAVMLNQSGIITAVPLNNAFLLYPTVPLLYHFCNLDQNYVGPFSNQYILQKNTFNQVFKGNILMDWSRDIYNTYKIIISMIFLSFVLIIIYLVLLKYYEIVTIFGTITGMLATIPTLGYFFWESGKYLENENINARSYFICAIILWVSTGIYICLILCYYKKIKFGVKLIEIVMKYLWKYQWTILFTMVILLLEVLLFVWWLVTMIFILSGKDLEANPHSIFTEIKSSSNADIILFGYFFFGGVWIMQFVYAFMEYVLASTTSIWYFGNVIDNDSHKPLTISIFRAIKYHMGSLAMGGLIVWFTQILRIFVEFIQIQKPIRNDCFVTFSRFFCCPFRYLVEHFNRQGYIHMGFSGQSFMESSKHGIQIFHKQAKKSMLFSHVGQMLAFFGNIFISTLTTIAFYLIITRTDMKNIVDSRAGPCIIVFFTSLVVSGIVSNMISISLEGFIYSFLLLLEGKVQSNMLQSHQIILSLYMSHIEE